MCQPLLLRCNLTTFFQGNEIPTSLLAPGAVAAYTSHVITLCIPVVLYNHHTQLPADCDRTRPQMRACCAGARSWRSTTRPSRICLRRARRRWPCARTCAVASTWRACARRSSPAVRGPLGIGIGIGIGITSICDNSTCARTCAAASTWRACARRLSPAVSSPLAQPVILRRLDG